VLGIHIAGDVRQMPSFLPCPVPCQMSVVVWARPSFTAAWSAA